MNTKTTTDYEILQQAVTEVPISTIENYYNRLAQKLADSSNSSKTYSSILKTFHNNKILLIPSLKKTFKKFFMAPFYEWSLTASRLQSHYEEAVYFLPLIHKKTNRYYRNYIISIYHY